MSKIDIDKLVCSFLDKHRWYSDPISGIIKSSLTEQGLEYRDGEIVENEYESDVATQATINLLTELKESEDEKIRRNIKIALMSMEENLTDFYSTHHTSQKELLAWLERQSEQKPFDYENANIQQKDFAPKVEPKFKVGDWITNRGHSYLIAAIEDDRYLFEIGGYTHEQLNWEYIKNADEHYHLWTIREAKDGDVLHCWIDGDEFILIYKGIKDGYITTYGHLYQKFKSFAEEPTTMFCRTIQGHFTPATKEQRDLLFAKMKEAGYTFDFEKKVLKKIEDEPENYKQQVMSEITNLVKDYIQQKNAWSEEDECYMAECINAIATKDGWSFEEKRKTKHWLKSLKDRMKGE